MSDTKKEIVKGSSLRGALIFYEHILLLPKEDKKSDIFMSIDDLFKIIKLFDFETEHKKTRTWGTPIIDPEFNFIEFREFLLNNENCSVDDMEVILRFMGEYYERKSNGGIFIEDENIQS